MKSINTILGLFILTVITVSCSSDDSGCSRDGVCTLEFRTIVVEVLDSNGNRVNFDEFTVTNLQTGERVELEWEQGDLYPIADDSMTNDIPQGGQQFELVGFIGGFEVLRQVYLVGSDCCHIVLLDGDTTVRI